MKDALKNAAASVEATSNVIQSPFLDMPATKEVMNQVQESTASKVPLEFTRENVDKVLEEVRPFLISDGGNVAVVRVDAVKMTVELALQGACGSCPSSTVIIDLYKQ